MTGTIPADLKDGSMFLALCDPASHIAMPAISKNKEEATTR